MQSCLGANYVQDNSLPLHDLASETQEHLFQRYSNTGDWGSQKKVDFKKKSDQGEQNPSTPKHGEYYASFVVSAVLITSAFHSSRAEKWATGQNKGREASSKSFWGISVLADLKWCSQNTKSSKVFMILDQMTFLKLI